MEGALTIYGRRQIELGVKPAETRFDMASIVERSANRCTTDFDGAQIQLEAQVHLDPHGPAATARAEHVEERSGTLYLPATGILHFKRGTIESQVDHLQATFGRIDRQHHFAHSHAKWPVRLHADRDDTDAEGVNYRRNGVVDLHLDHSTYRQAISLTDELDAM